MRFCAVTTAQARVLERWLLAIPVNIHKSQQQAPRWKTWVPRPDGIGDRMDAPGLEDVVKTNMYIGKHVWYINILSLYQTVKAFYTQKFYKDQPQIIGGLFIYLEEVIKVFSKNEI